MMADRRAGVEQKDGPRELRVKPIKNGTVIDHIAGGRRLMCSRYWASQAPQMLLCRWS